MVDKNVSEFYDEFSSFQEKIAYNERHFLMLDKLLELGLNKTSNVLELGCGIGVVSSLICRVVKSGKLIAVDISPKSIEIAKKNNATTGAEFYVGDVTEFKSNEYSYDFITLFDVLEHIPIDSHDKLFASIAEHMSEDTKLIINIPNPDYLRYIHDNSPDRLQIIDQPLPLIDILENTQSNELELKFFETYDLWLKDESQFMVFEKKKRFVAVETKAPGQTYIRRLQNKFKKYW